MPRRKLRYNPYKVPLEKKLLLREINVSHIGFQGATTGGLRSFLETHFPNKTRATPFDACILLAGTNDILQNKDLKEAMDNIRAMHKVCHPLPTVVITLPRFNFPFGPHSDLFPYCSPKNPSQQISQRRKLNVMIRAYGKETGCGVVDTDAIPHDEKLASKDLWFDCVHPTEKGYAILADMIAAHLKSRFVFSN